MKRNKFNIIRIALFAALPAIVLSGCTKDTAIPPTPPTVSPVTTTGTVALFAGSNTFGSGNGTGAAATFSYPTGLATDVAGNVYVADQANNQIRKITSAGAVTTLSGTLLPGSTNATAIGATAAYNNPSGVAIDAANNVYIADFLNNQIRKITVATGAVTTLAGATASGSVNAIGAAARFNGPAGVAADATGNIYVADYNNNQIRKISADGVVTLLAGSTAGNVNGVGAAAKFNGPRSVAVDLTGNVYVADANNNVIRKIAADGTVTTLAGTGAIGNADGAGTAATFYHPAGVAVDALGNVYVADTNNNLVRKITAAGVVSSLAGSGYLTLTAPFNAPAGITVNAAGTMVYVASALGNTIHTVK
ncbi:hypothetical protein A0256_18420 [Mucilaginibacter sp. PAMC 26640]|nr:hypothetical protein A0256_18420 [Mucilaginibacter sp. PAMC 26640]